MPQTAVCGLIEKRAFIGFMFCSVMKSRGGEPPRPVVV